MNIELQTCSLEQARKLKQLGVLQMAQFWSAASNGTTELYTHTQTPNKSMFGDWAAVNSSVVPFVNDLVLARFTCAELGVMLPNESGVLCTASHYSDHMGQWYAEARKWNTADGHYPLHETECDTEAEARAELLIWLLENKHITADQVNEKI